MIQEQLQVFIAEKADTEMQPLYWKGMCCFVLDKNSKPIYRFPSASYSKGMKLNKEWLENNVSRFGVSGWDADTKTSHFVTIDIDNKVDEKGKDGKVNPIGVNHERMAEIIQQCSRLPYLEVRRSTHGNGLHIRAYMDNVPCVSEDAHSKLGKQLITAINMDTTLNLLWGKDTDVVGRQAWIYSDKQNANSFMLISSHSEMFVPMVQQVVDVKNTLVEMPEGLAVPSMVDIDLVEKNAFYLKLSDSTKSALDWIVKDGGDVLYKTFEETNDAGESHSVICLQTHTASLARAHKLMSLAGGFTTVSTGTNKKDVNCFCVPSNNGGLRVIRFGGSGNEKDWLQDSKNRAYTFFNDYAPLAQLVAKYGGQADNKGYQFNDLASAVAVVNCYATKPIEVTAEYSNRKTTLVIIDDNTAQLRVDKLMASEPCMAANWFKGAGYMKRTVGVSMPPASNDIDDEEFKEIQKSVRHIVMHYNSGMSWWEIKARETWVTKTRGDLDSYISLSAPSCGVPAVCGRLMKETLFGVDVPFGPDMLSPSTINITKAKLIVKPAKAAGLCTTWLSFLGHIAQHLDAAISIDPRMSAIGIKDGKDYLIMWIAMSIRKPEIRLPYLFLYGPQETGKSLFHESLRHIISRDAIQAGVNALTNATGFNGELLGATHVFLEEMDLSKNTISYNRLKDMVTAEEICIRPMRQASMMVPNYTHWIQVANDIQYCPIESADTRITMIEVTKPAKPRPKHELSAALKEEAGLFLRHLLDLPLPSFQGRLGMPVVETENRNEVMSSRSDNTVQFTDEQIDRQPGCYELLKDIYEAYVAYCTTLKGPAGKVIGRTNFVKRLRDEGFVVGQCSKLDNRTIVGNCSLIENVVKKSLYNNQEPILAGVDNRIINTEGVK